MTIVIMEITIFTNKINDNIINVKNSSSSKQQCYLSQEASGACDAGQLIEHGTPLWLAETSMSLYCTCCMHHVLFNGLTCEC